MRKELEKYKNIIGSVVTGKDYSDEEILERIEFQEKYFEGMLLRK